MNMNANCHVTISSRLVFQMPPVVNSFDTSLAEACHKLVKRLASGVAPTPSDVEGWTVLQTRCFLDALQAEDALGRDTVVAIGSVYGYDAARNSEIRFRWQVLALRHGLASVVPEVVDFLAEQGRMKFVRPLFRELYTSAVGKDAAIPTFQRLRDGYQ